MSDTNRKNTGRKSEVRSHKSEQKAIPKSEAVSPASEQKAQRPKRKVAKTKEETHSAIITPNSELNTPRTANSQLQTDQMEVHHHPEVEKK